MTVHCTNCGTAREVDIVPEPPTPYVHGCPACQSTPDSGREFRKEFSIQIEVHDEEGPVTRLAADFEAPSLRVALDDGTLANALSPLWERLQQVAHLAEDAPPAEQPEEPEEPSKNDDPEHLRAMRAASTFQPGSSNAPAEEDPDA